MTGQLRLQDLWVLARTLRTHWLAIVLAGLLGPLVAGVLMKARPSVYKAQSEVLVEDSEENNPFLRDIVVPWKVKNRLPVIQGVLRSQATLRRVLEEMGTITARTSPIVVEDQIKGLRRRLEVFGLGGGLVRISYSDTTPERARRGLDILVKVFVDEMLGPQTRAVEDSADFLGKQLERLRTELTELESKTAQFKSENAGELPEVYRLNLDSYLATKKALTEAEVRLESLARKREVIEARLKSSDPVVQRAEATYVQKRAEIAELLGIYTEAHPKVVALTEEAENLARQISLLRAQGSKIDVARLASLTSASFEVEPGQTEPKGRTSDLLTGELLSYRSLLAESESTKGEIALLEKRLNESQDAVRAFAKNEQELTRLVRETDAKATIYKGLLGKYEDALVTRELSRYDEGKQVWIVDPPSAPNQPQGPPFIVVLIAAFVGGASLASAAFVALDLLRNVIRAPHQAERVTGLRVLGELPVWKGP